MSVGAVVSFRRLR